MLLENRKISRVINLIEAPPLEKRCIGGRFLPFQAESHRASARAGVEGEVLIPSTTQGRAFHFGTPVKGKSCKQHRIQYPPHLFTVGKQSDCAAVSVTVARMQIVESKGSKGACCLNVAQ